MNGTYRFITLSLFLFFGCLSYSQENNFDRILTYPQLWEEILTCQDSIYGLQNALVTFEKKDYQLVDSLQKLYPEVDAYVYLKKISFKGYFDERKEEYSRLNMKMNELHFNRGFKIIDIDGVSSITSLSVVFAWGFRIQTVNPVGWIELSDCEINGPFSLSLHPESDAFVRISNSNFNFNKISPELFNASIDKEGKAYIRSRYELESQPFIPGTFSINDNRGIIIEKCQFNPHIEKPGLLTIRGNSNTLYIDSTYCGMNLDLYNNNFSESFVIKDSRLESISFTSVILPDSYNMYMPFNQLTRGISVQIDEYVPTEVHGNYKRIQKIYRGETTEELADQRHFDELISIHKRLNNIYRDRGDLESSNACYVDMKRHQTKKLKNQYSNDKNLSNLIYWKLNSFLDFFALFGTSPVRSIIVSVWTILSFALVYFFFYSEWDKVNRTFLITQHKKMMKYFRSNQSLEDFYTDKYKEEFQSYAEYKKEIQLSKVEIPMFLNILGKPLYHISLLKHKIMVWLYKRTEILHGTWNELEPKRKLFVGTSVGVSIFFYLIYLVLIRTLNALVLSINSFSTLGFGEIPVKGISRYMAIIEGFFGWFCLSIFSVSLISQILQG